MTPQQEQAARETWISEISEKLAGSGVPEKDARQTAVHAVEGAQAAITALGDYFDPIEAGPVWTGAMGIALQLITNSMQDQMILLRQIAGQFGIAEKSITIGGWS